MNRRKRCTCGARFDAFRTGLTFADVKQLMYVGEADPTLWRNKSRRAVLGHWHEIKRDLWDQAHGHCPETFDAVQADNVIPFVSKAGAEAFARARARQTRRPSAIEVKAGDSVISTYSSDWHGRVRRAA